MNLKEEKQWVVTVKSDEEYLEVLIYFNDHISSAEDHYKYLPSKYPYYMAKKDHKDWGYNSNKIPYGDFPVMTFEQFKEYNGTGDNYEIY